MSKYQESLDRLNTINMVNFMGDKELIKHKDKDVQTLQELVDKETPMKVKHNVDWIWHKYGCGSCDNELDWKFLYCPYCGQKLDWSEE